MTPPSTTELVSTGSRIPHEIRLEAIREAKIFYGMEVEENPTRSNSSFFIDQIVQRFGGKIGWAWCMYFVQECYYLAYKTYRSKSPLCFRDSDGKIDLSASQGHCYSLWRHAIAEPKLGIILAADIVKGVHIPEGGIFIRYDADHTGHTGIVISHWQDDNDHDRDIIRCIEGNASDAVTPAKYTLASLMSKNFKGVIC